MVPLTYRASVNDEVVPKLNAAVLGKAMESLVLSKKADVYPVGAGEGEGDTDGALVADGVVDDTPSHT